CSVLGALGRDDLLLVLEGPREDRVDLLGGAEDRLAHLTRTGMDRRGHHPVARVVEGEEERLARELVAEARSGEPLLEGAARGTEGVEHLDGLTAARDAADRHEHVVAVVRRRQLAAAA